MKSTKMSNKTVLGKLATDILEAQAKSDNKPELSDLELAPPKKLPAGENAIQRMLEYLKTCRINKRQFYIKTGLSNGFLDKSQNIGSDKIEKIITSYPNLNVYWLITGQGEMIITEQSSFTGKHKVEGRKALLKNIVTIENEILFLQKLLMPHLGSGHFKAGSKNIDESDLSLGNLAKRISRAEFKTQQLIAKGFGFELENKDYCESLEPLPNSQEELEKAIEFSDLHHSMKLVEGFINILKAGITEGKIKII